MRFFAARLPAAGFTQRDSQVDPLDAESDFTGADVRGRWVVEGSAQYSGATDLTAPVQSASAVESTPDPEPTASAEPSATSASSELD